MAKFVAQRRAAGLRRRASPTAPPTPCAGADIITTCTADKTNATVLTDAMVGARRAPQRHRRRLPRQDRARRRDPRPRDACSSSTSRRPASRARSSRCRADFPVTELWQVITGARRRPHDAPSRSPCSTRSASRSRTSRALRYVHDAIAGTDATSSDVDLIAEPADPKDLFGLRRARPPSGRDRPTSAQAPRRGRPDPAAPVRAESGDRGRQRLPERRPDPLRRASLAADAYAEVTAWPRTLREHGVTVHLFEDDGTTRPDSVFPNNWFSTHAGRPDRDLPDVLAEPAHRAPRRRHRRR